MAKLKITSEVKNITAETTVAGLKVNINLQKNGEQVVNNLVNFYCSKSVANTDPMTPTQNVFSGSYNLETNQFNTMNSFEYSEEVQTLLAELPGVFAELKGK